MRYLRFVWVYLFLIGRFLKESVISKLEDILKRNVFVFFYRKRIKRVFYLR